MSSISLGVLRHLHGLDLEILPGGEIDRRCLGGQAVAPTTSKLTGLVLSPQYWRGGLHNPARSRVYRFLWDLDLCVQEIAKVLRHKGRAAFIVARRSIGGWQLKLDQFLVDAFERQNIRLENSCKRRIEGKMTPLVINKRGRSMQTERGRDHVLTIREEHILTFYKA